VFKAISCLRILAQGKWTHDNAKQLVAEKGATGLQLFETRLNKGQRLLWERAISFSPRLTGSGTRDVWTQSIRVWSVASRSYHLLLLIRTVDASMRASDSLVIA
jgi:hypothetical protein